MNGASGQPERRSPQQLWGLRPRWPTCPARCIFSVVKRISTLIVIVGIGAALAQSSARAQFGNPFVQLPKDDFTWFWGDRENLRGIEDFQVSGTESGFHCDLTARLSPASQLSRTDVRSLSDRLRASLVFIQDAAGLMNQLDYQHDLDWARLVCKTYKPGPVDQEAKAEREAKAREKALREQAKRRARRQQDDD